MPGLEQLLWLVAYILVGGLVVWAINWFFTKLGLPQEIRWVAMAILGIVALILILRVLGAV